LQLPTTGTLNINGEVLDFLYRRGSYFVMDIESLSSGISLHHAVEKACAYMESTNLEVPLRLFMSPWQAARLVAEMRRIVFVEIAQHKEKEIDPDVYDGKEHTFGRFNLSRSNLELIYTSSVPNELLIFRY
jgi:hypothetical protein